METTRPLELTTRFAAITTAEKRGGERLSPEDARKRAYAHFCYIDRASAVVSRVVLGVPGHDLDSQAKHFRQCLSKRSERGGARGTRIAERVIFSLPNDLGEDGEKEALESVLRRLIPSGSEAMGWGVVHGDKPGNRHCHLMLIDGPESIEAARSRRPGAKRVRRRDVIHLGELGRPKELREAIAEEINLVARRRDARSVEWRSFKARGIQTPPSRHKGPQRLAQAAREAISGVFQWLTSSTGLSPISELFADQEPRPSFFDDENADQDRDDTEHHEVSTKHRNGRQWQPPTV